MIVELEVYSNEQWRDAKKGCWIVKGSLAHLRAYVERWMARDRELDSTGMDVYHCYYIDPLERLTAEERDALGDELLSFEMLIHPGDFETCDHGMSANLCCGPQHYPLDM